MAVEIVAVEMVGIEIVVDVFGCSEVSLGCTENVAANGSV